MRKCTLLAAKVSSTVLLSIFMVGATLAQSVEDVAKKLEQQVVDHRKKIHSIDAEVMSNVTFADGRSRKRTIAYEFSNGKKRCKVISSAHGDPDPSGNQSAVLTIATGDFFLYYDNAIDGDDALTVADLRQPTSAEAKLFEEPDLRLVGLLPDTFANLDSYAKQKVLQSSSFRVSNVEKKDRQLGFNCNRVDYAHKESPQVTVSVWYRESWEYEVVKVLMSFGSIVETVTTEAEQFDNYGWFPKTVLYERNNGAEIEKKERLEIKVNSLNVPIDPRRFTLASACPEIGVRLKTLAFLREKLPEDRTFLEFAR